MNSPLDPGSPTDSASTSGTPPPEEVAAGNTQGESRSGLGLFQIANQITAALSGSSSKRRNPSSGTSGAGSSARDPKSRRRGDSSRSTWETRGDSQSTRKEKEDLVDANIVDYLRKEIGDPFLEVSTSMLSS